MKPSRKKSTRQSEAEADQPQALRVIVASLIADGTLAVAKCLAALFSGSAAMAAEAFHSLADTTNQSLLLVGRALSKRPADPTHPFGYGMERFFWPFVVCIVISSIGGLLAILRGVEQIRNPHPLEHLFLNYIIFMAAFVLEGAAWIVAWKELKKSGKHLSIWQLIRESKTPAIIAVFLQDAAAVIGVLIAMVGTWAAQQTQLWLIDGVTSILIGLLLFSIAVVIAIETKSLLIGESASPSDVRKIRSVIHSSKQVEGILAVLTMHLGPEEILVNLDLQFKDGLTTDDIEAAIDHIERHIREAVPSVSKIFIEAKSVVRTRRKSQSAP